MHLGNARRLQRCSQVWDSQKSRTVDAHAAAHAGTAPFGTCRMRGRWVESTSWRRPCQSRLAVHKDKPDGWDAAGAGFGWGKGRGDPRSVQGNADLGAGAQFSVRHCRPSHTKRWQCLHTHRPTARSQESGGTSALDTCTLATCIVRASAVVHPTPCLWLERWQVGKGQKWAPPKDGASARGATWWCAALLPRPRGVPGSALGAFRFPEGAVGFGKPFAPAKGT